MLIHPTAGGGDFSNAAQPQAPVTGVIPADEHPPTPIDWLTPTASVLCALLVVFGPYLVWRMKRRSKRCC